MIYLFLLKESIYCNNFSRCFCIGFMKECSNGHISVCVCEYVCVCVCVCVWKSEKERERKWERVICVDVCEKERKIERGKEREGVCVTLLDILVEPFVCMSIRGNEAVCEYIRYSWKKLIGAYASFRTKEKCLLIWYFLVGHKTWNRVLANHYFTNKNYENGHYSIGLCADWLVKEHSPDYKGWANSLLRNTLLCSIKVNSKP